MIKEQQLKFFIFGDSICVGQGVSINKSWVARIAGDIEKLNLSHQEKILIANSSINGNTTRQALERMPYDIQSHEVDVLSIQFGLNDCNYWATDKGLPRVSPRAFAANLAEIIERGFNFGAKIIYIHTNHPTFRDLIQPPKTNMHSYDENNRKYNDLIRETAHHYPHVNLIDIENVFDHYNGNCPEKLHELLLPDGLHLSSLGHELYYENIKPKILPTLLNLIKSEIEMA